MSTHPGRNILRIELISIGGLYQARPPSSNAGECQGYALELCLE